MWYICMYICICTRIYTHIYCYVTIGHTLTCVFRECRLTQRTFCGGCVVVFNSLLTIIYGILMKKECLGALYDRVIVHVSCVVACTHIVPGPPPSTSTAQGHLPHGQGGVRLAKQKSLLFDFQLRNCAVIVWVAPLATVWLINTQKGERDLVCGNGAG